MKCYECEFWERVFESAGYCRFTEKDWADPLDGITMEDWDCEVENEN